METESPTKKYTRFNLSLNELFLVCFTGAYLIGFTIYFFLSKNPEFFWYTLVVILLFAVIAGTIRKSNFHPAILWGLSIWGLLHMAGGSVLLNDSGGVLYGLELFHIVGSGEYFILKYDQLVHFFGFGVATAVGYGLLRPQLKPEANWKVIYLLLVLIGMGFGVVNEIIEFVPVVLFENTGVGGYGNLALDLVFNTLGAITAVMLIHFFGERRNSSVPPTHS